MANLDILLIKWENRLMGDTSQCSLNTVDGIGFMICEPTPFSPRWYSHKFNGPGLCYELAIYRGYCSDIKVYHPDHGTNDQKIAMGKACACHETANWQLKNWNVRSKRFRHSLKKHHLVFCAVLVIEQIKIQH
eukprot:13180079-Ditylum_brightwellii.AAC.1